MSTNGYGLEDWARALGVYTDAAAIAELRAMWQSLDEVRLDIAAAAGQFPDTGTAGDMYDAHVLDLSHDLTTVQEDIAQALRGFEEHLRGNSR